MRWRSHLGLAAVALVLALPAAAAHGDAPSIEARVVVPAGDVVDFERGLHYHRVVGTVAADDDAPVELLVRGPDGQLRVLAGPGPALRVNHLIECCRDSGNLFDAHVFALRNPGPQDVRVTADLALLHDDFAVVAYDAEPGAWWQTLVSGVLLAAVPAWVATRAATDDAPRARRWTRIGWASLSATWFAAAALSVWGMARYGAGPLGGFLSAHASFPVVGVFLNSNIVTALPMVVLWELGIFGWVVAVRRQRIAAIPARALAWAAAAGPPLFGLLLLVEYGNVALAAALGILPAGILVATDVALHRFRWARVPPPAAGVL